MKKVKVIFDFYDKFHLTTLYKAGDEVEFDDDRADDIVTRGLGRLVKANGKTEKTPDPEKGNVTPDPEKGKGNTADTDGEGKTDTKEEKVNDGGKTETETEEEKKKASERKAAEILAKVNKK